MSFLVVGLLLAADGAVEPRPRVQLVYEAEARCPDRRALDAAVSARLGYSPFDERSARVARVRLFSAGPTLRGTLELVDGERSLGRKTFASKDCQELASSVALALAIALDPLHAERPVVVEPMPPAPVSPPAPAPVPVVVPVKSASPLIVGIGLTGRVLTGVTPLVTGSAGLELSLRWGALEFTGRGHGSWPVQAPDLRVSELGGSVAMCGALPWVGLCAVGGGSVLTLTGPRETVTQGIALAGARVVGRFEPVPRLWLLPFVELLAVLTRVIALSGDEVLWTTSPLSFSAGLTIRYEFQESGTTSPKGQ